MNTTMTNKAILREVVIETLQTIFDPEIPVDIYQLGLIYEINISDDNKVNILMTLTAPNCPVAETLPVEVREAILQIDGVRDATVDITFEPPWDQELISDEAKLELGLL